MTDRDRYRGDINLVTGFAATAAWSVVCCRFNPVPARPDLVWQGLLANFITSEEFLISKLKLAVNNEPSRVNQ